ncbi:thiamine monophosphate synthase [Nitzschia inconspicua]|uniref:Thiamine monophosphate synthase n=1 Tax=Nitzschia inconspicua TaxID=303405 RepID=A0A9K3PRX4_9STRA|nr:thiamine monophosphate synthase [Nitzschia inconspicua]
MHRHHSLVLVLSLFVTVICSKTTSLSLATSPLASPSVANDTDGKSDKKVPKKPPIVYTIAGSDSGGGAGIQADLHAIHAMGCHGCSAITCLTAQNSKGVTGVHAPPPEFLKQQLKTLLDDLPPRAIKIGMLGTSELAKVVGDFLKQLFSQRKEKVWIVLDPVMISTSGSKLLDEDAIDAMIEHIFPYADVVTPNKFEAEALLGRSLTTPAEVEEGARELLKLQCRSVLIKGGHTLLESSTTSSATSSRTITAEDVQSTLDFAQDYLLSSDPPVADGNQRLCDASQGVWLRTPRWDTDNTHGTGCTLSSAIASALALGEESRHSAEEPVGAFSSMDIADACCLAKAYVSAGIQKGVQLGSGPGPVAQTGFPSSYENFPSIVRNELQSRTMDDEHFVSITKYGGMDDTTTPQLGRILPIVDTVEWVQRLSQTAGVTDIQLRIKDLSDKETISDRVTTCQQFCQENGVRLWINDHWEVAIQAGCFGVHVGQEDLWQCVNAGGLEKMKAKGVALGISTHSYGELAAALGVKPSYISMGPVFATSSKKVAFDPQGLETVSQWRKLIPPSIPFVTIGGINNVAAARLNKIAGSDCIAVITAVTQSGDPAASVAELNSAMTDNDERDG